MIPKKGQVRRLGFYLSRSLFVFFLSHSIYAVEIPAFTENLPPLNYEENGINQGYSVELLQAIAQEAGIKVNIQVMPWARAYQTALETPNALLFTLVRNAERENQFLWIGPIAKRKVYLFKLSQRSDIAISDLASAKKYRIGAVRESASTKLLMAQDFQIGRELDVTKNDFINMKKLIVGRIDLMVSLDWAANFAIKKEGGTTDQISRAFLLDQSHEYYFGVNKNTDPEVYEKLAKAFDKVKKNGLLKRLQIQHLGPQDN